MSLVPSFTVSPTSQLGQVNVVDTSTGSDGAITDRIITILNASNAVIGTFDFPLSSGSSINIQAFTADGAVNFQINWVNNVGVPLYTFNLINAYVQYAENFYYSLTQQQQGNPSFLNDQQYFQNKSKLRVLIDSALQAISYGSDIFSANTAISLYQILLNNPTLYF